MIEVIFLGSKPIGYHCLRFLIENKAILDCEVKAVFSNDNTRFGANESVKQLAASYNIPYYSDISEIDSFPAADYLISVQYHQILKAQHIKKARIQAVNLHMAPLPEYRGCNQFTFAILNEEKQFGTTLHVIDEKIDHGHRLAEIRFDIPENCFVNDLYELTYKNSLHLFKENIGKLFRKELVPVPYRTDVKSHLYFRKDIEGLKHINLSWDKNKIEKYIRALSMPGFEPPYYMEGDKKVYLTEITK